MSSIRSIVLRNFGESFRFFADPLEMFVRTAREIDPTFSEKLGKIITKWAFIEALQAEFLAELVSTDPGAMYIMTQNVSARSVTNWIRTMAPLRLSDDETQQRIHDLLASVDEVRAERNALAHGIWGTQTDPETVTVQTVRWERSEVVKTEIWTVADLDDLYGRITKVATQLNSVVKRIKEIKARQNP